MKLSQLLGRRNCYHAGHAIACCLYPMETVINMGKETLQNYVKKRGDDVPEMLTIEEIDNLVHLVNIEVKDENCPRACRNRFYQWKHKYIKKQIASGNIDKVIESNNYYHFFIKNGNDYHQLKNTFPNGVDNIVGTEVYTESERNIPFNEEDFNKSLIQIILFINQKFIGG